MVAAPAAMAVRAAHDAAFGTMTRVPRCGRTGVKSMMRQGKSLVGGMILLGAVAAAQAGDYYASVSGGNVPPYTTPATAARSIQAAVDRARDGDTVWLAPGTYYLAVPVSIVWKGVTVRSMNGRDATIVDGQNLTRCFLLSHPLAKVQELTIRNGNAPPSEGPDSYGGGVYCQDGGMVASCIVERCSATYGAGVRIRNVGEVTDSILRYNTAGRAGGGVQTAYGGTIAGSTIHDNTALYYGGGVYCYEGGAVELCDVYANSAKFGGGIRLYRQTGQTPTVTRTRVRLNQALAMGTSKGGGGGIQLAYGGAVDNSLIYDNVADAYGGGVHHYQGGALVNCTVAHNATADTDGDGIGDGYGGGVYTTGGGSIQNTISFWNVSRYGANYYNTDSAASYQYCLTAPWIANGNNVVGVPNFVDNAARNYALTATSPALDVGRDMTGVDFIGHPRRLDGKADGTYRPKTDIGAYEYGYFTTDDSDGDGMPTGWESLFGLNPNSAADATNDLDGDFVQNRLEYELGSFPNDTDSDDDGLQDGVEYYTYGSSPTRADSDGDGFGDKVEVDALSDPAVPGSYSSPTNAAQFPASISGTVTYGGTQTGRVTVVATTASNRVGQASQGHRVTGPMGAYTIPNLPTLVNYWLWAFRDTDGDGVCDTWEAIGQHAGNPVRPVGNTTGIGIVLGNPTTDSDGDGLGDFVEIYTHLTNPYVADTDGDGMPDGWEVTNGLNPLSVADATQDIDNDGLNNRAEYNNRTNPRQADTDGDGMPDGWEVANTLNPTVNDAAGDDDHDELTNLEEHGLGTLPNNADTDGDQMPDGWENRYGLNPKSAADRDTDYDYDGLTNIEEHRRGTQPNNVDTDGDGMPDGWENGNGLNPLADDSAGDPDGDGLTNIGEFLYGVDPHDPETDGDGVTDGREVTVGSDPANPDSYPVDIIGATTYGGAQTGDVVVIASWTAGDTDFMVIVTNVGPYALRDVGGLMSYYVRAYRDSNGNATQDTWEAAGAYTNSPFFISNSVVGIDIALRDPVVDTDGDGLSDMDEVYAHGTDPHDADSDSDGMDDGWEVVNSLNPLLHDARDDDDGDRLPNIDEYQHRSDPHRVDTDGDGLPDFDEVRTHGTDPADPDTDNDGLRDDRELGEGTDPLDPDSDDDGYPDGAEVSAKSDPLNDASYPERVSGTTSYSGTIQTGDVYVVFNLASNGNTRVNDPVGPTPGPYSVDNVANGTSYWVRAFIDSNGNATQDTWEAWGRFAGSPMLVTGDVSGVDVVMDDPVVDTDGDGAIDIHEVYTLLTDPHDWDTDDDGMPDGWEADFGLFPHIDDGADDADGDGIPNLVEYTNGTRPDRTDTDADLMPDAWELANGTDGAVDDAAADLDRDGLDNLAEYRRGTDPRRVDTDGDTYSDGEEVTAGTDPTDPTSFPMRMSGTTSYAGTQTGNVHIVLAPAPAAPPISVARVGALGAYTVSNVANRTTLYVTAYRDSNGNATQDTWEAWGGYSNNPVFMTNNTSGIDIELRDPGVDTDGDGATDYDEVYVLLTDPGNPDSDGDSMPDGWEADNGLNPRVNDSGADPDFDGLTNVEERQAGTHPNNRDTDGDNMPDGYEVDHGLDPRVDDSGDDADGDGLTNGQEHAGGTDPQNTDSDFDGMPDGWETLNGLNPQAIDDTGDPDGDRVTNIDEYLLHTDPQDADSDNDGFDDGRERVARTNPNDPLSFPVTISGDIAYTGVRPGPVYVVLNLESNATRFLSQAVPGVGPYSVTNVPTLSNYWIMAYMDIDSNGTFAAWEPSGVYTNSPIAPTADVAGVDIAIADSTADTDGDGLSDFDEVYVHGTNPNSADTDGDQMPDGFEVATGLNPKSPGDAGADPDGDGLTNLQEFQNGTLPLNRDTDGDGMWDGWEVSNGLVATNAADAVEDPDAEGVPNLEEFQNDTDPNDADSDDDTFDDRREIDALTDPNNAASFPATASGTLTYGGIQTGVPYIVVEYAADGSAYRRVVLGALGAYAVTNMPTLSNYTFRAYLDSNGNATQDTWEAEGAYGNNPVRLVGDLAGVDIAMDNPATDTDGDGLTDFDEVYTHLTSPTTNDTDGDLLLDGWEAGHGLDPNDAGDALTDPDADGLNNVQEQQHGTDPQDADTDDDGLLDGAEVNAHLTSPTDADSDGDGMPDGWEVDNGLDPLDDTDAADDEEPDLLTNLAEFLAGTNPRTNDTDGDLLLDWAEINTHATDPTKADTDGDMFDDYTEIRIGSDPNNYLDPVVVDDDAPGDPGPGNPAIDSPNENGRMPTTGEPNNAPYDAIQEGIDAASGGMTVLVLPGTYLGVGNRNVQPKGKAITIRSLHSHTNTVLADSFLRAFNCSSNETTNTVIQGFTIHTWAGFFGGEGVLCNGASPTIRECRFWDCGTAGLICTNGASPLVEECLFEENEGAIRVFGSSPTISRCRIDGNWDDHGAGMHISGVSAPMIVNSLIVNNEASATGGGIYIGAGASPTILNCTIASNSAVVAGGGIWTAGAPFMGNSIVYGNVAPSSPGIVRVASVDITFSCIQESTPGPGNITSDPMFVMGGYAPASNSPAVNAGTSQMQREGQADIYAPRIDLVGVIRPQQAACDMGCHEYVPAPDGGTSESRSSSVDADGDGLFDVWEETVGLSSRSATDGHGAMDDPDGDGAGNYAEMMAGTDPLDADSVMRIRSVRQSVGGIGVASEGAGGGSLTLEWAAVPGYRYRVEVSTDLASWAPLGEVVRATDTTARFVVVAGESRVRFYRVVVAP